MDSWYWYNSSELQSSLEQNQQLSIELKKSQNNARELETQLKQQKTERLKSAKEVTMLNRAVTRLTNKLNNQTEEYQHKNKSIELINDEILSLSIQNNLLTDKVDKLEKENGDLVERWIEKVKADADKMNETNAFLEMYGSKNSESWSLSMSVNKIWMRLSKESTTQPLD